MALLKDGIYYRIARVDYNFTSNILFANVYMERYNSIEDREKTKQGIEYLAKDDEIIYCPIEAIRVDIYAWLKEHIEKFKDAEDV